MTMITTISGLVFLIIQGKGVAQGFREEEEKKERNVSEGQKDRAVICLSMYWVSEHAYNNRYEKRQYMICLYTSLPTRNEGRD